MFHLPIWARFYDIPFKGRGNDDNARVLGNKIGVFMEASKSKRSGFDKSMRIRVKVDVHEPLKDSVKLEIRGGQIFSIPVKYERLPMVCFFCGRLGHGTNECVEVDGDGSPVKRYGMSLRASPWKTFEEEGDKMEGRGEGGEFAGKANKLFVTKTEDKSQGGRDNRIVDEVAEFLERVSIDKGEGKTVPGLDTVLHKVVQEDHYGTEGSSKGGGEPIHRVVGSEDTGHGTNNGYEDDNYSIHSFENTGDEEKGNKEGEENRCDLGAVVHLKRWKRRRRQEGQSGGTAFGSDSFKGKRHAEGASAVEVVLREDRDVQRRRMDCMEIDMSGSIVDSEVAGPTVWALHKR